MDESYSTHEAGQRYALFHVDRKLRMCVVERALLACGMGGCKVDSHDGEGAGREWYNVLQRHLEAKDARVVAWVRAGKMQRAFGPRRRRGGGGAVVVARESLPLGDSVSVESAAAVPSIESVAVPLIEPTYANIILLNRAAALREAEHARALCAKDAEMRAVLERREEAIRCAAEAEERLAVVMFAQGSAMMPAERELSLSVDLIAEQRRTNALADKLKTAETRIMAEQESASVLGAQRIARIRELEGEMTALRGEAARWECGLEEKRLALVSEADALALATTELRQLRAACAAKDGLIAELRQDALALARAELEAEMSRREEAARADVALVHQEMRFKSRRWKKVNESLHDQLLAAVRRGRV